jgi:hypothetical protein
MFTSRGAGSGGRKREHRQSALLARHDLPRNGSTGTQPLAQLRPTSPARNVAHRNCDGLLLPDQNDQPLAALSAALSGTAFMSDCISMTSTMEVSSTTSRSQSSALSSPRLKPPPLGSTSSSRWMVLARRLGCCIFCEHSAQNSPEVRTDYLFRQTMLRRHDDFPPVGETPD